MSLTLNSVPLSVVFRIPVVVTFRRLSYLLRIFGWHLRHPSARSGNRTPHQCFEGIVSQSSTSGFGGHGESRTLNPFRALVSKTRAYTVPPRTHGAGERNRTSSVFVPGTRADHYHYTGMCWCPIQESNPVISNLKGNCRPI
jgi:hypothetical protein